MSDAAISENKTSGKSFGDSWVSLALMVGFIVLGRIYLLEPFKIPSGSMEPTLIGHEEFGDRILTNKLAYVATAQALLAAGAFLVLILQGLSWSVEFARDGGLRHYGPFGVTVAAIAILIWKSFGWNYPGAADYAGLALFGVLALHTLYWYALNGAALKDHLRRVGVACVFLFLVLGGMAYAWTQNAVAAEPQRFDVPVFEYTRDWEGKPAQDINYIKRLVGLPGDKIMVSGGDLFLFDKKTQAYEIIRKWKVRGDAVQDALWFPVSRAFEPRFSDPNLDNAAEEAIVKQQLRDLAFPWTGSEDGTAGVKLEDKALVLDGVAPVDLNYKFPVTNTYLKQGRWPFKHIGCPASKLPPIKTADGISWRNPNSKPEDMEAVVSNTWEGVQCPNCRHVFYPVSREPYPDGTRLVGEDFPTRFFYGGDSRGSGKDVKGLGDLKIEMKLHVEKFGSLHIELGNTIRDAIWNIPGGGEADTTDGGKHYFVQKQTPALAPGDHALTLAYVDGTIIAMLDGNEIERRELSVQPLSALANRHAESIARIQATDLTGKITALNLSRDLYWTTTLQDRDESGMMLPRATENAKYDEDNNLVIRVQEGEYLMMGDNSPSSSDGRVWGLVPRERLMGRAWVVGWPLSRWKIIR